MVHRLFSLLFAKFYFSVDITVNSVLFKSAACIDLACFCQLPCSKYFLFPMLIYKPGFRSYSNYYNFVSKK